MTTNLPIWLIPIAPIIGAMAAGLLALTGRAKRLAPVLTIAATALSLVTAIGSLPPVARPISTHLTWLELPPAFAITLGASVDRLSWLMVLVVCSVSILVQVYSTAYMSDDPGYARYFAYIGLFSASMLGLVVADNLFQLYVCWELVGICSYLLIGFWHRKPSAASAAKKAFVVTRFGDVGFMLGLLFLSSSAGSFGFGAIRAAVDGVAHGTVVPPLVGAATFLWLVPVLLFCGAVGKSAQFPLHIWLPDAMEGPTPVSALIHAATMVAAGVYMVARLFALFAHSAAALDVVLVIGAVTALVAATIALVQTDIKKVMAYSTISQLGYMMMALGAAGEPVEHALTAITTGQVAGMFHLTTHAMFKALLFLCAGAVIHSMHHAANPNDLRQMGGLLKRTPITAITGLVGVLALAGFPLLSGFWSKDAVLGVVAQSAQHSAVGGFAVVVGYVVAALTAFYSMRMWLMAFWGAPRSSDAEHAHESPAAMTVPLIALALPSLGLGWWLHQGGTFATFLSGSTAHEAPNLTVMALATACGLVGLVGAALVYARPFAADPIERLPRMIYAPLANLWYMDLFWTRVVAGGWLAIGGGVAWFDRNVIDGAVRGIGTLTIQLGGSVRKLTTGQAQRYAAYVVLAVVLLFCLLSTGARGFGQPARELAGSPVEVVR